MPPPSCKVGGGCAAARKRRQSALAIQPVGPRSAMRHSGVRSVPPAYACATPPIRRSCIIYLSPPLRTSSLQIQTQRIFIFLIWNMHNKARKAEARTTKLRQGPTMQQAWRTFCRRQHPTVFLATRFRRRGCRSFMRTLLQQGDRLQFNPRQAPPPAP